MKVILSCALVFALAAALCPASEFRVEGGEFVLEGQLTAARLAIESGAWLRGNGTLVGDLDAAGHISPGGAATDSVGTQRVQGAAAFASPATFHCYAATHTSLDRLEVAGTVSGDCDVTVTNAPGAIPVDEIVIRGGASSGFGGFAPVDSWTWQLTTTGTVDLLLTNLRGDSDANGLPDEWELRNFAVRTGTDPLGDADDDEYLNEDEYHANTGPNDSNSLLQITRILKQPDGTAVTWDTAPGRRYTLVTTTNLPAQQWSTSTVLTAYAQPAQTWTTGVADAHTTVGVKVEENRP